MPYSTWCFCYSEDRRQAATAAVHWGGGGRPREVPARQWGQTRSGATRVILPSEGSIRRGCRTQWHAEGELYYLQRARFVDAVRLNDMLRVSCTTFRGRASSRLSDSMTCWGWVVLPSEGALRRGCPTQWHAEGELYYLQRARFVEAVRLEGELYYLQSARFVEAVRLNDMLRVNCTTFRGLASSRLSDSMTCWGWVVLPSEGSLRRGCPTQWHAEGELYYLQRARFVEAVRLNDMLRVSCTTFRGLASSRLSDSMTCWGWVILPSEGSLRWGCQTQWHAEGELYYLQSARFVEAVRLNDMLRVSYTTFRGLASSRLSDSMTCWGWVVLPSEGSLRRGCPTQWHAEDELYYLQSARFVEAVRLHAEGELYYLQRARFVEAVRLNDMLRVSCTTFRGLASSRLSDSTTRWGWVVLPTEGALHRGCPTQRHAEGELYYLQRARFVEAVRLNDTLRVSCTTYRGLASSRLWDSMTCWGWVVLPSEGALRRGCPTQRHAEGELYYLQRARFVEAVRLNDMLRVSCTTSEGSLRRGCQTQWHAEGELYYLQSARFVEAVRLNDMLRVSCTTFRGLASSRLWDSTTCWGWVVLPSEGSLHRGCDTQWHAEGELYYLQSARFVEAVRLNDMLRVSCTTFRGRASSRLSDSTTRWGWVVLPSEGSLRRGCPTQRHAEGELYYLQRARFVEAVRLNDMLRVSCTTFRGLASSRLSDSMTCWGWVVLPSEGSLRRGCQTQWHAEGELYYLQRARFVEAVRLNDMLRVSCTTFRGLALPKLSDSTTRWGWVVLPSEVSLRRGCPQWHAEGTGNDWVWCQQFR